MRKILLKLINNKLLLKGSLVIDKTKLWNTRTDFSKKNLRVDSFFVAINIRQFLQQFFHNKCKSNGFNLQNREEDNFVFLFAAYPATVSISGPQRSLSAGKSYELECKVHGWPPFFLEFWHLCPRGVNVFIRNEKRETFLHLWLLHCPAFYQLAVPFQTFCFLFWAVFIFNRIFILSFSIDQDNFNPLKMYFVQIANMKTCAASAAHQLKGLKHENFGSEFFDTIKAYPGWQLTN